MTIEDEKELNKLLGIKIQFASWSGADEIKVIDEKVILIYSKYEEFLMFHDYIKASIPEEFLDQISENNLEIVITPNIFNMLHDQMVNAVDHLYEGSTEDSYSELKKEM